MKKVSCVITTFNRLELLKKCIKSVQEQTYEISTIIIINNNSTDGTKNYLEKYKNYNNFIIKNMDENLGGAGGFSHGVRTFIEETSDDLVWIMDDDTIPSKTALEKLVNADYLLRGNYGFLCSNVQWVDGTPINLPELSKDWAVNANMGIIKVDTATFVSFLVKRSNIIKYGLPIKDLFILGDDIEYSLRLSTKYNSYYITDSIVLHETPKINVSLVNDSDNRIGRYYYYYRNRNYIKKKYKNLEERLRMDARDIVTFFNILCSSDKKIERIISMIRGKLASYSFHPKISYVGGKNRD